MYRLIRDDNPNIADSLRIHEGINQFNASVFSDSVRPLSIFIKDDNNNIVGGVLGYFDHNSLYIIAIWVDESLRHQNYGSQLLQMAETEVIKEGCKFCTLDTFGFQAEAFYIKNGYRSVGETKEHIFGYSRISLRKDLI